MTLQQVNGSRNVKSTITRKWVVTKSLLDLAEEGACPFFGLVPLLQLVEVVVEVQVRGGDSVLQG